MSVPKSARHTAGQIKEAGANAAGATETSTPVAEVSHVNQPDSTTSVGAGEQPPIIDGSEGRRLIDDLRRHPVNQEIYGEDEVSDLVATITDHGVLEPLWITPTNVVIAGHRRLAASLRAGLKDVPVAVINPADDNAAVDLLLASNVQRVKTNEQIAREAAFRMRVEREKARRRQVEAGARKVPANSPEAGDARAIVAKQMRIGQKQVDKLVAIVDQLDKLKADGDTEHQDALTKALKNSAHRAHQMVQVQVERKKRAQPDVQMSEALDADNGSESKANIMARLQEDLVDGIDDWEIETLWAFESAVAAFKLNWIATQGKEAI